MQEYMQTKGISASTLKTLAIIGMTLNHIAIIYEANLPLMATCLLRAFGGITFPIMAYLLGEGYKQTANVKKYAMRLLVFACIAEAPFRLFLNRDIGNVLFTLFLGLIAIHYYERIERGVYFFLFVCLTIMSSFFDWGGIGLLMIVLYYVLQDKTKRVVLPSLLTILVFLLSIIIDIIRTGNLSTLESLPFLLGCSLSIPLLLHYNGRKGTSAKYLFYVYYPLHILVLGICKIFLG